jgi:hypothetical protein
VLKPWRVRWQGIHVCAESRCAACGKDWIEDLPVGHAQLWPFVVDVKGNRLFGDVAARKWFGKPLLESLRKPSADQVEFKVERFFEADEILILNCLDFLYGHALLKLLNFEMDVKSRALVLLLPSYLRWMAPKGAAEIWCVELSPKRNLAYYPSLEYAIERELQRFSTVYLSPAHSHPPVSDISLYTGIKRGYPTKRLITFVWREDRVWGRLIFTQWHRVLSVFRQLRKTWPDAVFSVAGLGARGSFPAWVQDDRVVQFDANSERRLCGIYAQSALVFGIHGSNMLLPSAHAPLSLHLTPRDRWGNLFQDTIIHEKDARLAMHRHRYLPSDSTPSLVARVVRRQVDDFAYFESQLRTQS